MLIATIAVIGMGLCIRWSAHVVVLVAFLILFWTGIVLQIANG